MSFPISNKNIMKPPMNKKMTLHVINTITLIALGSVMIWLSWNKWMDVWIDFGDDLFVQWKILKGAVLYKDIAYFRGPFSIYLNVELLRLFGTGINTLIFAQLFKIAALAFLTYRFFLETSGIIAAFMTSAVFLTLFAFPEYGVMGNFNFVCPYTYAIVDGFVLTMIGFYIFLQFIKKESLLLLFSLGIIGGTIFLTKVELFYAFCFAILSGFILWRQYLRKSDQIGFTKALIIILIGSIIPIGLFLIYFSVKMPWLQAMHALTLQYIPNPVFTKDAFYLQISGFDAPDFNITGIFIDVIEGLMLVMLIAAIGYILCKAKVKEFLNKFRVLFLIFFGFIFWAASYCLPISFLGRLFHPLPPVILIFLILGLRRISKAKSAACHTVILIVFSIFSFILLIKIFLKAFIGGYGFVLALPSIWILIVIMLDFMPKEVDSYLIGTRQNVRNLSLGLIVVLGLGFVYYSGFYYQIKVLKIGYGADKITSFSPQISGYGLQFQKALDFVNANLKANETFLVLPEGTLLNYLSRRDTGTHYFKIFFAEKDMWSDDAILQDFRQHPPDYILYKPCRGFGISYGPKILPWIWSDYKLIKIQKAYDQRDLFVVKRK